MDRDRSGKKPNRTLRVLINLAGLAGGLFLGALLVAAAAGEGPVERREKEAIMEKRPIPPMDVKLHSRTAVATFGLG